jgi:hypothetical protein
MKTPNQKNDPKKPPIGCQITLFGVILIIILSIIFSDGNCSGKKGENDIDSTELSLKAYSCAKQYVKTNLLSPSTADFPWSDYRIWILTDSTVVIKSYVDAENVFGAKIRQDYRIRLKWYNDYTDIDDWNVLEFGFE